MLGNGQGQLLYLNHKVNLFCPAAVHILFKKDGSNPSSKCIIMRPHQFKKLIHGILSMYSNLLTPRQMPFNEDVDGEEKQFCDRGSWFLCQISFIDLNKRSLNNLGTMSYEVLSNDTPQTQ